MKNGFYKYHPIVELVYFISLAVLPLMTICPYVLLEEVIIIFTIVFYTAGRRLLKSLLWFLLFFLAVTSIINPIFSNRGTTKLFSVFSKPIFLEPVVYGVCIFCVVLIISFVFIYIGDSVDLNRSAELFGGKMFNVTLLIRLVLMGIPRMIKRYAEIKEVNDLLYYGGGKVKKLKNIMATLINWSLEDAVSTSKMMNARGYGQKRKASCLKQPIKREDVLMFTVIILFVVVLATSFTSEQLQFIIYPSLKFPRFGAKTAFTVTVYGLFLILPFLISIRERVYFKKPK